MKKTLIAVGILIVAIIVISLFYKSKKVTPIVVLEPSKDEVVIVKKYVRDNIKTIAIDKPVLGGSWYVVSINIDKESKTGDVVYEDGHIQSKADFKYTLDVNDVVTIVFFKTPVLNTKYISSSIEGWPPVLTVLTGPFSCKSGGSMIDGGGNTVERTIDGKRYCVTTQSEGAAGSMYISYSYKTSVAQTVFTLRFSQCENYDDIKKTACKKEQSIFNPDIVVEPDLDTA